MKKIIGFLIILIVIFGYLAFNKPEIAVAIESKLGIEGTAKFLVETKLKIDDILGRAPTKDELIERYNQAYSGVIEFGENVKDGIETTKDTIDDIRLNVDKTTESINNTVDSIGNTLDSLNQLHDTISSLSNSGGTSSGTTSTGITQ